MEIRGGNWSNLFGVGLEEGPGVQMASSASSIINFTRTLVGSWWTGLSGLFSVAATFLALYVSNDEAKIAWGLAAFLSLWFTAYRVWKIEHDKVVERDAAKRQLLGDIAALREKVGDYRIGMEQDHDTGRFNQDTWQEKYNDLENEIGSKIEQLSSKAEARTYLYRGNLERQLNTIVRPNQSRFRWPVLVDISVRDLDYLETFIHNYSRGKRSGESQ
jgi:hypothetical protein